MRIASSPSSIILGIYGAPVFVNKDSSVKRTCGKNSVFSSNFAFAHWQYSILLSLSFSVIFWTLTGLKGFIFSSFKIHLTTSLLIPIKKEENIPVNTYF